MSKSSVEGLSGNFEQLKSPSFVSDLNGLKDSYSFPLSLEFVSTL